MNVFKEIFFGFGRVIKRELSRIASDKDVITIILLAPLFYGFFYSSLYWNKTEKNVPIAIVDMDNSEFSKEFTKRIDSHENTYVKFVTGDLTYAKKKLDRMDIHGIIVIPSGSEKNFKSKSNVTIKALLNTTRFLVSNDINKAVTDIAFSFNDEVRIKYFMFIGMTTMGATNLIEPVRTDIRPMFNKTDSYGDFLIPGLLIMILHQTLLIGLAESIAKEREDKTLKDLYNTSYNNTIVAIFGKTVYYFILFSAYAVFSFIVYFGIFNISISGNLWILALITGILIISIIFLCIFISSFFKRKIIALQVIAFSSYPLFFITGYAYPRHALPSFIQHVADLFALTPYLSAYLRLTQMGAGLSNIRPELIHLIIITIAMGVLAFARMHYLFKKEAQKNA